MSSRPVDPDAIPSPQPCGWNPVPISPGSFAVDRRVPLSWWNAALRIPAMAIKLFHRTSAKVAKAIVQSGLKDGTGNYLTENEYSGVWLSNVPLDADEGARGDTVLEVTLDISEKELEEYEWVEEGQPYREWLIPASLINGKAIVRVVPSL
jgi:hypothetical protein